MTKEIIPVYNLQDMNLGSGVAGFELARLEEAFSRPRQNVRLAHRHDYYEVFWISSGNGMVSVDFFSYPVKEDTLCFLSPGQVHAWSVEEPLGGSLIRFTGAFYAENAPAEVQLNYLPVFYQVNPAPLLQLGGTQSRFFSDLIDRLHAEFFSKRVDWEPATRAYLHLLMIEVKRLHLSLQSNHLPEAAYLLVKQFLLLVEKHFTEVSSNRWYSTELGVSPAHLNTLVKKTMGKTTGEVVQERKLLEAKRLLRYSDKSISEIAFRLNFEDPSYFARFFKKFTRLSPGEFRGQRL